MTFDVLIKKGSSSTRSDIAFSNGLYTYVMCMLCYDVMYFLVFLGFFDGTNSNSKIQIYFLSKNVHGLQIFVEINKFVMMTEEALQSK